MIRDAFNKIGAVLTDVSYILSPEYRLPSRKRLLADYIRLRFKVFLNNWLTFREERFLGYRVRFANYSLFFETFRQIFVRQSYYFKTDKDDPAIIDCGGNMGVSVLYFKYLYPRSKIIVFEPSPEILPILKDNLSRNSLKDVTLREYAISGIDGEATFYERGTGSCGSTLVGSVTEPKATKHTVQTRRLSSFIEGRIDMLKLDIEGAEGGALEDLHTSKMLDRIGCIALEYHYFKGNSDNSLGKILSSIERCGRDYQIYLDEVTPGASLSLLKGGIYYCLVRIEAQASNTPQGS